MDGRKVALVGAGQMGALLAERIPRSFRKVIISQPKARAVALADEVGGVASDQFSAVRGCDVIFLMLPDEEIHRVIKEVEPHVKEGALLVNTALTVMTGDLSETFPNLRFAAVKVLGDAAELMRGGQGAVLIDHAAEAEERLLRGLVGDLGPVSRGSEQVALAAGQAVVAVMAQAEAELRRRLTDLGLDEPLVTSAVAAAGPAVLRSLAQQQPVSFMEGILQRYQDGEAAAP